MSIQVPQGLPSPLKFATVWLLSCIERTSLQKLLQHRGSSNFRCSGRLTAPLTTTLGGLLSTRRRPKEGDMFKTLTSAAAALALVVLARLAFGADIKLTPLTFTSEGAT